MTTHKLFFLATVLIVAGILVALFWQFQAAPAPQTPAQNADNIQTADTENPTVLQAEVEGVDLGDLDADFKGIDADINSL